MGWLVWVVGVAAVVAVLVVVDRLVAGGRFDRYLDRPRPVRTDVGSTVGGLFDSLGDVFQPNREHLTAEKERQRLDIQYAGDDAPPFDLDSGTVVLRAQTRDPDEDARHPAPRRTDALRSSARPTVVRCSCCSRRPRARPRRAAVPRSTSTRCPRPR